jgi:pimeloyl-ACP methyl ester carboxylesterase
MTKEILYEGKKIVYNTEGSGKPVFLLHGFGELSDVWRHQADVLKNNYTLIIPDLPGSDRSEMLSDRSMEGMAEAIHAILHEENIDTCTMIGHSMGGYILLAFAEKYRNHLNAFGLFHSSAFADTEEKKATRRKGIEFIRQNGGFEFLKTATPNLFSPLTKDEHPQLIDEQIATLSNFSGEALVSYYESMINRPDRTELLRKATVPVLFVMGKYDVAVPMEDGLKQCHLPEKSYIHILQKSGHMGMLEEAEESNRVLENFLLDL